MQRPTAVAVALSIVSFPFLLPHVVEDFRWGIADRIGMLPDALAALVGLGLAGQALGVALGVQERRSGLTLIALAGTVWAAGAVWDHGMAVLVFGFGFRGHPMSAVWVMGLMVTQALAAGAALVALVHGRSGSRPPAAAVTSLILAVRFLTIVPVPGREAVGTGALGRAAWWFPVVGLALGAGLALGDLVFGRLFPPLVAALLVVALWKTATGGVHLDGLADCLDGLAGTDPARRLAIMRDSRIGVFGAGGLVLSLLIATASLGDLSAPVRTRALILAPVIGRLAPLLVSACFAPATPGEGLGAGFRDALPRWAGAAHLMLAGGLAAAVLGPGGLVLVAAGLAAAFAWSALLARRLGGVTGDVLGAGVELAELGTLLAAAAIAHRSLL